jgi:hypothetical protein
MLPEPWPGQHRLFRSFFNQLRHRRLAAVMNNQRVARFEKVSRHRLAHDTQSYKTDSFHFFSLISLNLVQRTRFSRNNESIKINVFIQGCILVFHRPYNFLFTAKSQRAQRKFSFSFAAETPANENHHAFGKLIAF